MTDTPSDEATHAAWHVHTPEEPFCVAWPTPRWPDDEGLARRYAKTRDGVVAGPYPFGDSACPHRLEMVRARDRSGAEE
jgi:hypothetical protein